MKVQFNLVLIGHTNHNEVLNLKILPTYMPENFDLHWVASEKNILFAQATPYVKTKNL